MKRGILVLLALMWCSALFAQNFEYKWQRVRMDTTYESSVVYEVDKIIANHQEQIAPLMEILVYSDGEIVSKQPESALSNLAADVLLHFSKEFVKNDYPTLSITNYGGIRSNFPSGAVRLYDVYSTFPFNNSLVVAELSGKEVRKLMEQFASREKFEALGGVEIVVRKKVLEKCLIGGEPLDDNKMYNVATIDFLLDGGDRFNIGKNAENIYRTGIVIRDAVEKYLRALNDAGSTLKKKGDGRVKIYK